MAASNAGAQPPGTAQQDGGAAPGSDGEAGRVQALDTRFAAIEEQQRQDHGLLEKIAAAVTGGGGGPAPGGQGQGAPAGGAGPAPKSLADQVREEIAAADQRRKAEEDDKTWRAGVTEVIEKVRAEGEPRPPQTGLVARARRVVLGKNWDA